MFETTERPPLDKTVKVVLIVWCSLLPLWALVASISGMAFDSGPSVSAYIVFYWFVFAYPTLVVIAFFCRRKLPLLIWLPLLAIVVPFASVIVGEVVHYFW